MVKRLPAMWETRVRFLGRKDPLEKEMAIHSSTLAWKIPWTEEPDRLQSMGSQRVRTIPFYHLTNPCNTTVRYVLFLSFFIKYSSDNSEFSKMGEDLNLDIGPKAHELPATLGCLSLYLQVLF